MSLKVRDSPDGSDSLLPLQGALFQSLAGELRSYMLCSAAKKKKKDLGSLLLCEQWPLWMTALWLDGLPRRC